MKKAILYCRVSSDEQAKGGSLKYQADALKRFCESNGIEVVDIYREDYSAKTCVSGKKWRQMDCWC